MHRIKTEYIYHIIAIIAISILCCLRIKNLDYIAVLNDEFGYWGTAVTVAGYDWKELMAETPYYSWGYSIWLIPIVYIIKPWLWYKAAIWLNVLFLICSYGLCIKVIRKIFPDVKQEMIFLISLIVIVHPNNITYAQVAWSETLLYLLMWCATYFMVQLEYKFEYRYFIGTIAILGYMYSVHARTIGIIFVGIIALFFIVIKHKKNIMNIIIIPLIMVGAYILNGQLKNFQIQQFLSGSDMSNINNVGLNQDTFIRYFQLIIENVQLFIESLAAKFLALQLEMGMTFLVTCIVITIEIWRLVKNRQYSCVLEQKFIVSKMWIVACSVISLLLCSLQMLDWYTRKDIIVYSRYFDNTLGPILALSLIYCLTKVKEVRWAQLIGVLLGIVGLKSVYWRISEADSFFNTICTPFWGGFMEHAETIERAFMEIAFWSISLSAILILSTFFKRDFWKNKLMGIFLIASFVVIGFYAGKYVDNYRMDLDKAVLPIENIISATAPDKEIYYIYNENDPASLHPKYLQFMIEERKIHVVRRNQLGALTDSGVLILTNKNEDIAKLNDEISGELELLQSTEFMKLYISK